MRVCHQAVSQHGSGATASELMVTSENYRASSAAELGPTVVPFKLLAESKNQSYLIRRISTAITTQNNNIEQTFLKYGSQISAVFLPLSHCGPVNP